MGKYVYVRTPAKTSKNPTGTGQWADKIKDQALIMYLSCGNLSEVSRELNIPRYTLKDWKESKWWKEKAEAIRNEEYDRLDSRLSKLLEKSLDQIQDRLEKGDKIFNPKTGKLLEVPVKLRDANTSFKTLMDTRQVIRKQPTKIVEQSSTAHQLANLAAEFAKFVSGKEQKEDISSLVDNVYEETLVQGEDGVYEIKDTLEEI